MSKRYYARVSRSWDDCGYVVDAGSIMEMDEVADRLNAYEAECQAWRDLARLAVQLLGEDQRLVAVPDPVDGRITVKSETDEGPSDEAIGRALHELALKVGEISEHRQAARQRASATTFMMPDKSQDEAVAQGFDAAYYLEQEAIK